MPSLGGGMEIYMNKIKAYADRRLGIKQKQEVILTKRKTEKY